MYILHLYYVHLQFKFSSRFFFYETGTSISIFILPVLCKLFQYISELEFIIVTIKNGTNGQNDPNCIMSFNPHDNTGNKALLALSFLLYGWRPPGMGMLNDTGSGIIACFLVIFLVMTVTFLCPLVFLSRAPPLLPVFTKSYYTLVSASTYSKIPTLPCLLLDIFKHKLQTNLIVYIEIKS